MRGAVFYEERNVWLANGSRGRALYDEWKATGKASTKKELDRLSEYCDKAEACFYQVDETAKLRKEYSDVL